MSTTRRDFLLATPAATLGLALPNFGFATGRPISATTAAISLLTTCAYKRQHSTLNQADVNAALQAVEDVITQMLDFGFDSEVRTLLAGKSYAQAFTPYQMSHPPEVVAVVNHMTVAGVHMYQEQVAAIYTSTLPPASERAYFFAELQSHGLSPALLRMNNCLKRLVISGGRPVTFAQVPGIEDCAVWNFYLKWAALALWQLAYFGCFSLEPFFEVICPFVFFLGVLVAVVKLILMIFCG